MTVHYGTVAPLTVNYRAGQPFALLLPKGLEKTGRERGTIKRLTANTAREGLSEVRQEPVNLCKRLGVSGVVVEH